MNERITPDYRLDDLHAEAMGLAALSGWNACAECLTWRPMSEMEVYEGYYYCPGCKPDSLVEYMTKTGSRGQTHAANLVRIICLCENKPYHMGRKCLHYSLRKVR